MLQLQEDGDHDVRQCAGKIETFDTTSNEQQFSSEVEAHETVAKMFESDMQNDAYAESDSGTFFITFVNL